MKKLFYIVCSLCLLVGGCQKYDDTELRNDINDLKERVETLETLCQNINNDITALKALVKAVETRDYITNVTPITGADGVITGYTISFANSDPITIRHGMDGDNGQDGEDGQDGSDGRDGTTPVIGVSQGEDGVYYWTLNGEWLLDDDGNKIKASGDENSDGADGADGVDGKDGKDGVTPQLKIEDGMWYVSYDNGGSWHEVGPATGEQGPQGEQGETGPQGPQGAPGVGGDSMFADVDYSSSADYVIFTLSNGTQIKIPTWSAFEALQLECDKMNRNIAALQEIVSALQNNDYIVSVTPIYEGINEIGYKILFGSGTIITIYHGNDGTDGADGAPGQDGADGEDGTDGANGQDGKDGITPVIGVRQDTDGVYYWTINGEWLLDDNGQKVKAVGEDGEDSSAGSDGTDGKDGKDGVTPQLKIENGMWYVSYDNGGSWHEVGQATGDQGETGPQGPQGPQGAPGVGGDSMFTDVDYSSSTDYVIFTLSNGTQIKIPTWAAFEALQVECEKMNRNIVALQEIVSALQNNDYIVSVTPIYEGIDAIGYIITFSSGNSITIYHGKDGQNGADGAPGQDGEDGEDGKDGRTPVMGVRQDSDGIYYWTINGEWLLDDNGQKVKAVGEDGKDGSNGTNGSNGRPGQDGENGKDGVTPQLKIENGMWYVSYDNGGSWHEVGQATGDQGETGPQGPQGPQGAPGVGGDSMFTDVDYSSSTDYVIFTLSNGTQIKVPTWAAFEALQVECEKMNRNIVALQEIVSALQNNDYVVSVTPIHEGGKEIGYSITFGSGKSITIYHGNDGKDGAAGTNGQDGKDGVTPVIGVRQDTDGVYYWTINGEWLLDGKGQKVKAVGEDGKDGSNGTNGSNGRPGQDGENGKDGMTPQLKIENGMWYVSYDNGSSWHEVGQATGDQGETGPQGPQGPQGAPGVGGDSMFTDVDYSTSADYVIFTLSNGTQIKVPTWSAFEALQVECEKMNRNIEALQDIVAALQNHDYIVSVTPIHEGGKEIGYSITFGSGKSITIYHGNDGKDGAAGTNGQDGKDGVTPVIGVRQDTDGVYYWTINGEWLLDGKGQKVKAVGEDGKDGSNGTNGSNGRPGQDGENGKDGMTPQLKIENGMWYVSYDNGSSWHEVGQATGDQGETGPQGPQGPQGAPGDSGDSLFKLVTQDESNVYFTLADGTKITIPKESPCPVEVTLGQVTHTTATFNGKVDKKSLDLKVTIHYSTSPDLTVYDSESVTYTKFSGNTFSMVLTDLLWETQYYYFLAVYYNGKTYYSDVKTFLTTAVPYAVDVNLSSSGTANSYIVSTRGSFYFSAVKGNSSNPVGEVASAEVLWETFGTDVAPSVGDLIRAAVYEDGKIYFMTGDTFLEGNAVIAAKDASGNILWSWHIWITDQPKEQEYYNEAGTMMDRNLGATSATPGDVGALGLLYQWGRKDPFLGSSSISSRVEAKSTITWPSAVSSNSSNGTIEYAVSHPTTFITENSINDDWYYTGSSSTTDNTRWTTSDKTKSIYDPCPAGWRVPDGGDNGIWSKALWSSSDFDMTFDGTNKGINFSGEFGSASTIWYTASGYRFSSDGSLSMAGYYGNYWSASPYSSTILVRKMYFNNDGHIEPSAGGFRACGYSVRCVRE